VCCKVINKGTKTVNKLDYPSPSIFVFRDTFLLADTRQSLETSCELLDSRILRVLTSNGDGKAANTTDGGQQVQISNRPKKLNGTYRGVVEAPGMSL